jgi:hypothetical protein
MQIYLSHEISLNTSAAKPACMQDKSHSCCTMPLHKTIFPDMDSDNSIGTEKNFGGIQNNL